MMRVLLVIGAVLLSAGAGVHLLRDSRAAVRGDEPVTTTLARYHAAAPGVVIVLQPRDCLGDGSVARGWNALSAASGLRVRGLVVGDGHLSPAQARAFARANLRMPVRSISTLDAGLLAAKLGHRATPFAVVVDARGRIAASFPAGRNVPHEQLLRLVRGS